MSLPNPLVVLGGVAHPIHVRCFHILGINVFLIK